MFNFVMQCKYHGPVHFLVFLSFPALSSLFLVSTGASCNHWVYLFCCVSSVFLISSAFCFCVLLWHSDFCVWSLLPAFCFLPLVICFLCLAFCFLLLQPSIVLSSLQFPQTLEHFSMLIFPESRFQFCSSIQLPDQFTGVSSVVSSLSLLFSCVTVTLVPPAGSFVLSVSVHLVQPVCAQLLPVTH